MGATIKVAEDNFSKIISDLKELKGKSAYVGVVAEPDSELAIYAGANEFGAKIKRKGKDGKEYIIEIPERSFLRSVFHDEAEIDKAEKLARYALKRFLDGNGNAIDVLNAAANSLVASVKAKINSDIEPDNAESTKARKNGQGTLRDTFILHNSISKQIVSE